MSMGDIVQITINSLGFDPLPSICCVLKARWKANESIAAISPT